MALDGRRFHLAEKLGQGAHGQVFLAELESQGGFRRKVVLKLLHVDLAHTTEAARRMRDEARILGRLAHRNIVTVIDLVRLDQRWAVVMDHLPGADLDRILRILVERGDKMPIPAALQAGVAVLNALGAAWNGDNGAGKPLRIVHRDIKPSNVLLTEDGEIKVLDFGVARVDMEGRESLTGQFRFGTERYMGPERLIGEDDTPAGDVYATAASVAELIIGEPIGRTPVLMDRHDKWLVGVQEKLQAAMPEHELSADIVKSLIEALQCEPEDRPPAMELATRWRGAARALPGAGLDAFALSFFPSAQDLLTANHSPADGVLEETKTIGFSNTMPIDEPEPVVEPEATTSSRKLAVAGGLAALLVPLVAIVLLALVGVGVAVVYTMSQPSQTVAVVDVPEDPPVDVVPEPDTEVVVPPVDPDTEPAPEDPVVEPPVVVPPNVVRKPVVKPVAEPATRGPVIAAALVVLPNASSLRVQCGDVSKSGTASVRLRNVSAGPCKVTAQWLGDQLTTNFELTKRAEIRCAVAEGSLTCSSS